VNEPAERPTEYATADLLPSSVAREIKGEVEIKGIPHVPIFCANCGADGGWVPRAAIEDKAFQFYLCNPCGEKWAPLAGLMLIPDDVFAQKVAAAQLEHDGRYLTPDEVGEALKDPQHYLSKLAKDRPTNR
jgi:hypothetical protein